MPRRRNRAGSRERRYQHADRAHLPGHREPPVQQALSRGDLGERGGVQDRDDQRDAVPPGHADVGGARLQGPADLPAQAAAVLGDQVVLVDQQFMLAPLEREPGRPQRVVAHEGGHLQGAPGDQGEVVGGDDLAWCGQAVGLPGDDVVGLQVVCFCVHQGDALGEGSAGLGEGDGRVVGGDQQQRLEQVGHLVPVSGDEADDVRLDRCGPLGGQDRCVRPQPGQHGDRGEHLQRAGRRKQPVRVLGREHGSGARVRDQVRRRGHGRQRPRPVAAGSSRRCRG